MSRLNLESLWRQWRWWCVLACTSVVTYAWVRIRKPTIRPRTQSITVVVNGRFTPRWSSLRSQFGSIHGIGGSSPFTGCGRHSPNSSQGLWAHWVDHNMVSRTGATVKAHLARAGPTRHWRWGAPTRVWSGTPFLNGRLWGRRHHITIRSLGIRSKIISDRSTQGSGTKILGFFRFRKLIQLIGQRFGGSPSIRAHSIYVFIDRAPGRSHTRTAGLVKMVLPDLRRLVQSTKLRLYR